MRRERDQLKMEKNESFMVFQREMEEERNQKRGMESEIERITFKMSANNDDI